MSYTVIIVSGVTFLLWKTQKDPLDPYHSQGGGPGVVGLFACIGAVAAVVITAKDTHRSFVFLDTVSQFHFIKKEKRIFKSPILELMIVSTFEESYQHIWDEAIVCFDKELFHFLVEHQHNGCRDLQDHQDLGWCRQVYVANLDNHCEPKT